MLKNNKALYKSFRTPSDKYQSKGIFNKVP